MIFEGKANGGQIIVDTAQAYCRNVDYSVPLVEPLPLTHMFTVERPSKSGNFLMGFFFRQNFPALRHELAVCLVTD